MNDTPKSMLKAAGSFFSGTMLSRVSGFLRDLVMAYAFGTGASVAVFFVAFRFAHLLRRLLGESTIQIIFVPQFESLRVQEGNSRRAGQFFIDLYGLLILVLAGVIAVSMLGCWLFLNAWSSYAQEVLWLCLLMLPSLFFICLAALNMALLQCEKYYFLPSVSSVAFNVVWILGALIVHFNEWDHAMVYLALCITLGCFSQWLVTLPKTCMILKGFGVLDGFRIRCFSTDLRKMWGPFLLGVVGIGASQINSGCDAIFAGYAGASAPAFLWYAIRLQQLPLALFGIALSGALLPPLSRAIKAKEMSQASLFMQTAISKTLFLIVPIACLMALHAKEGVSLLYGYHDFDVIGTSQCLLGYLPGLIPMALILVLAPAFYANHEYGVATRGAFYSVLLNLFLNVLFIFGFGWGGFSIALATSLSAWANLFYLIYSLDAIQQSAVMDSLKKAAMQIGLPSFISSIGSYLFLSLDLHQGSFLSLCLILASSSSIFMGLFWLMSKVCSSMDRDPKYIHSL